LNRVVGCRMCIVQLLYDVVDSGVLPHQSKQIEVTVQLDESELPFILDFIYGPRDAITYDLWCELEQE
jgi:hypothetical protein